MANGDIVLFTNIGLSDAQTGGQTSTVGEPSLANNGQQIFLTGNWYATRSLDRGVSWDFVSPFNFLAPTDGGFCCDQTVIYEPSRDIAVWLLQYVTANNTNSLRVAIKRGPTLGGSDWHWWDFSPANVNTDWQGEWFDYNHAALSNNFLYVASNAFRAADGAWTRSIVLRLPLDNLASGQGLTYSYFQSTDNFSLRCTLGARNTMYFASHQSNSQVRLFTWPDGSGQVTQQDVTVSAWQGGPYTAAGPDGTNWLGRTDPRITGAWVADDVIGLMWTANQMGTRPFPHVRVVRMNEGTKQVIDEPDIWNQQYAYAYPDACPNDRGDIGITLFRGGGTRHPGHVVGTWDAANPGWRLQATRDGTNGPVDNKWGDYLTCRRHSPDGLTWLAAGYTLQGGGTRDQVEPRLVHFGFSEHQPAVDRWSSA